MHTRQQRFSSTAKQLPIAVFHWIHLIEDFRGNLQGDFKVVREPFRASLSFVPIEAVPGWRFAGSAGGEF